MEILRVPSVVPQAVLDVEDPITEYEYTILDLSDNSVHTDTVASDTNAKVTIDLPSRYDSSYEVRIFSISGTGEERQLTQLGEEHFFEVVRPYVDPNTKGTSASEIAEYAKHEEIARAIIDSIIEEGFYYKKKNIQKVGLGADYLPIWVDAKKLLKIYENNVLIFDSEHPELSYPGYKISDDRTAITIDYLGQINLAEQKPNVLPQAESDILDLKFGYRGFPQGFDYSILLEVGYQRLPSDISRAAELLIEDISCGKLEYYTRYISDYNTDQFKIKFAKQVFEGTGNIIVDKILSKYYKSIRSIEVL
jgi:hypothetical protein